MHTCISQFFAEMVTYLIKLHSLKYARHSTPAYYAFYYTGIFDTGLICTIYQLQYSTQKQGNEVVGVRKCSCSLLGH